MLLLKSCYVIVEDHNEAKDNTNSRNFQPKVKILYNYFIKNQCYLDL